MGLFLTRRGIKAHGAHGCLQYRADGLFPIPAKNTDIEEQDEAAQDVHGRVQFMVLGGQNGGGANEENAKGGDSAQDDADEVGVKGGVVCVCSAVDNDVPHADPCHQGVEQYQNGSYGQVHGSVIAGAASERLGKGLGKRLWCRTDRALGAMLSCRWLRVCRHAASRAGSADHRPVYARRIGRCSCRRSGPMFLLSAVMHNLDSLFQNASPWGLA